MKHPVNLVGLSFEKCLGFLAVAPAGLGPMALTLHDCVPWSVAAVVSFLVATVFHSQPHTDAGVYNIFSVMNYGTMIFGFGALGFAPNRMLKPSIA
jgi:predicted anti-sigma-YlaC factor YlaD